MGKIDKELVKGCERYLSTLKEKTRIVEQQREEQRRAEKQKKQRREKRKKRLYAAKEKRIKRSNDEAAMCHKE